jgi:rhodanese-related sulfurtransferase
MKTPHELVLEAKKNISEISVDQAVAAIPKADILIDVREADEYAAGHIPGAVHFSRGMLEFKLASQPQWQRPDLNIVLYCKTSGRAALSAASLMAMGYAQVNSIAGGFDAWKAAGHAIDKPVVPSFE